MNRTSVRVEDGFKAAEATIDGRASQAIRLSISHMGNEALDIHPGVCGDIWLDKAQAYALGHFLLAAAKE